MNFYTLAAVQMNSQPNVKENLDQASNLIDRAAHKGALLISLPENFAYLGDMEQRISKAENISVQAEDFLREKAAEHQVYILGGSFPVPADENRVYNRSLLINPDGEIEVQYDKIHLFDVNIPDGFTYRESNIVKPGTPEPVTFQTEELGHLGLSICYDLRFPELYRKLVDQGAEILFVPSAFTELTGEAHWHSLLRARAIENTCYVVAPAQTGQHGPKRTTYGHSLIADPWGEIQAEASTKTGIILAEMSPDRIAEVRQQIPSLEHRVVK